MKLKNFKMNLSMFLLFVLLHQNIECSYLPFRNGKLIIKSEKNPVFNPKFTEVSVSDDIDEYEMDINPNDNSNDTDNSQSLKNMEAILDFVQFFLQPTNSYENTIEKANSEYTSLVNK
jgi:hypothetical protein